MAHNAVLVYRMLKSGHEYVGKGARSYDERHPQQQIALLKKRVAELGLQVTQPAAA